MTRFFQLSLLSLLLPIWLLACSDDVYTYGKSSSSASSYSAYSYSASSHSAYSYSFSAASVGSNLRVAVFNAEDFNSDQSTETGTWGAVADVVATNQIDLIILTETEPYDGPHFHRALLERGVSMDWRMTWTSATGPDDDYLLHDEVSIWSRFEILSFEEVCRGWFVDPVSEKSVSGPRYIARAEIKLGARSLWVYGMHLKANSLEESLERRRAQAHELENYLLDKHQLETDWVILAGDMNTTTPAQEFIDNGTIGYLTIKSDNPGNTANDFTAVNLKHLPLPGGYTWRSMTYPSGYPDAILDHLILSPALYNRYRADSVKVLLHDVEPRLSDHYPVILDIKLD